ncbi:MAG: methyltransferase domain-containing protein [Pseudomonadota bacterium]
MHTASNVDHKTVEGFGEEWSHFDQSQMSDEETAAHFAQYFKNFPWHSLPKDAAGFDMGCGSGRWAKLVAPRVGWLHCIDASSKALEVCRQMLRENTNVQWHQASVDQLPFADNSMDFGYSLGVLHHIPDTQAALQSCIDKLKPGAPFLVYLYYAFDHKPWWFRVLWRFSDIGRRVICRLPFRLKRCMTDTIATLVYWPLARLAGLVKRLGRPVEHMPLAYYRQHSFYTLRTDALDRFGTRLEQRFTQEQIKQMMRKCGLEKIRFNEEMPYWCAVGYKART